MKIKELPDGDERKFMFDMVKRRKLERGKTTHQNICRN